MQSKHGKYYVYLETLGGGAGGRFACKDGSDGIQIHMTNTSNLPIEALESEYPLMIERYEFEKISVVLENIEVVWELEEIIDLLSTTLHFLDRVRDLSINLGVFLVENYRDITFFNNTKMEKK